jgi:hypothetical protein
MNEFDEVWEEINALPDNSVEKLKLANLLADFQLKWETSVYGLKELGKRYNIDVEKIMRQDYN